jgi:hypothetical protein
VGRSNYAKSGARDGANDIFDLPENTDEQGRINC